MKQIIFTRQDNIEVKFKSSLKDVENLNENFLLTTRETTTYLEANLFYHFDSKLWTLNELLFFAENNNMIVSIYDENNALLKEYNYNLMRTKIVPTQEDYIITPADNGYLLSMDVGGGAQHFIINSAAFPVGFNVKLHSYGLVDGARFYTAYWNMTPSAADEGNLLGNERIVEIVKMSETLWVTSVPLLSL